MNTAGYEHRIDLALVRDSHLETNLQPDLNKYLMGLKTIEQPEFSEESTRDKYV